MPSDRQSIVKDYKFASETQLQSIQNVNMVWQWEKKHKHLTLELFWVFLITIYIGKWVDSVNKRCKILRLPLSSYIRNVVQ